MEMHGVTMTILHGYYGYYGDAWGCYGNSLILEHKIKNFKFYTLYGHLSKKCLKKLKIGQTIKKGEKFSTKNISVVRPGYGLSPKFYFKILGKKSKKNIFLQNLSRKAMLLNKLI